jgi:hypothetical protein
MQCTHFSLVDNHFTWYIIALCLEHLEQIKICCYYYYFYTDFHTVDYDGVMLCGKQCKIHSKKC